MQLHRKDLNAAMAVMILAIAFIVTSAVVKVYKHQAEIQQRVIHQNLVKLSTTQREILGLKSVVRQQQNVILAARGVGLLNMNPGPWMDYEITFYTGADDGLNGTGTGITKSGKPVTQQWSAAVDPNVIPLGSIIEVKFKDGTQQILQADDIGGAIRGQHVDVYDPSYADCVRRGGLQMGYVRILIKGR